MKTRVILTSFALATMTSAMFVSCSNEELIKGNESSVETQDGMIQLGENFMIGISGAMDPASRTHWELNNNVLTNVYMPVVSQNGSNTTIGTNGTAVLSPSIGLCWIGNGSVGNQVYTNYEFIHNGWLGKDQSSASFDECDGSLKNGWTYEEINNDFSGVTLNGSRKFDNEVITKNGTGKLVVNDGKGNEISSNIGKVDAKDNSKPLSIQEMNLNSGVYKTCNKAIFGGKYIAYYPYNQDFKDAGAIPVKSASYFQLQGVNDPMDFSIAENTFRYTDVTDIKGGVGAEGFTFKNLSGVLRVVLKGSDDAVEGQSIKRVMLYSESGSFVEEVKLDPSKIAAGAEGEQLYVNGTAEKRNTITVGFGANVKEPVLAEKDATKFEESTIYITALPTTVDDLKILVQNDKGQWAVCDYNSTLEIEAGKGKTITAEFNKFEDAFYVSDYNTLVGALGDIRKNIPTAQKPAKIVVLNDLVITGKPNYNTCEIPSHVIIEGKSLIVDEGYELKLNNNVTVKSDIVVKGQSCCSGDTPAGKLDVKAAKILGNITTELAEREDRANAEVEFNATTIDAASTVTLNGVATFKGTTNIFGNVVLNEKATATISEGAEANFKGGKLTNNGEINVKEKAKFNILDAKGQTEASAGKNFTNNGTFIDEVGAIVGGATQSMINNGDYICKVADNTRMTEAYEQKSACNIIDIVYTSKTTRGSFTFNSIKKHDGKDVDIIVSGNYVYFAPVKPITIGNLTIKDGDTGLAIAKTIITKEEGKEDVVATINVNGDINAYGNFYVEEDVFNMTAKNLYVHYNGSSTGKSTKFENRKDNTGNTLAVSGTIEVKKGATFEIVSATAGKNTARVTCTRLVEGGIFKGKPIVVE